MPLRKSPRPSAASRRANRLNALKSTGPCSARGKRQSRMNALRTGARSRFYQDLWRALATAPSAAVCQTPGAFVSPELARHELFSEAVEVFQAAELCLFSALKARRGN